MTKYTWVPFFEELGRKLKAFRNRRETLIEILSGAGIASGMSDEDENGHKIPLTEIDPYSFIGMINKHGNYEKRSRIFSHVKSELGIEAGVPTDFCGVPVANAHNTWLFKYKHERGHNDIEILWDLFEAQLSGNVTDALFCDALQVKRVGNAKLTQAMFCYQPTIYLPIDTQTKPFLSENDIPFSFSDFQGYVAILEQVKQMFPEKPIYELSYEAWMAQNKEVEISDAVSPSERYWTYSPGAGGKFWEAFYEQGIMAIGWDYLGDLSKYQDKEAIAEAFRMHDNAPKSSKKNNAAASYGFAHRMKVGDTVFAKIGRSQIIGVGKVISEYRYEDARGRYKHVRDVKWFKRGDWTVSEDNRFALKTLTDVTRYHDFVKYLKSLVGLIGTKEGDKEPDTFANNQKQYWWLNANPKVWDIVSLPIGAEEFYTANNSNGNKRRVYKYFQQVKPGDLMLGYVASPLCQIAALCKVTRGLHENDVGEVFEFEKIKKYTAPVSYRELQEIPGLENCEPLINNQGSLFRLTAEEFEIISTMLDDTNTADEENEIEPYVMNDALRELFMTEGQLEEMLKLLEHKKNIVLQGPPGVGKTFIAKRLAYLMAGEKDTSRIQTVQFHQSFSYEDFIQGIRPNAKGHFTIKDGIFHRFCARAALDENNPYVFIIDEINRGNLSKIFGEVMMLIESDKRGDEITLANSEGGETFTIPQNVYIIGTMNTADRSLAFVDYALRRRFCFIDVPSAFSHGEASGKFKLHLKQEGAETGVADLILKKMQVLNEKIRENTKDLGPGYEIGHSYFCRDISGLYDLEWYKRIISYEVGPLLREYWFDNTETADKHIESLLDI